MVKTESFARVPSTFDFNIMDKIFQIQDSKRANFNQIKPILRNIRLIFSQILPQIEALCPVFDHRAQLSIYTGRTSNILAPFFKLNANCRNIISMVFFIIVGNRALLPLSCRWLMPKYCSTIYLYFEMALFRLISKSVNFALILSLRIIPSWILFNARNFRFGAPAYPLSA